MNISLDYDNTYTRDPQAWNRFIKMFQLFGHTVYCVTMRYDTPNENSDVIRDLSDKVDGIFYTGRKAKQPFMFEKGISIDVWIDDMPTFILNNASS